ncbi:LysR family transcriptional regulator [Pandoraea iniqua]|uniref:LysR family transcriptional regulator n=1 Tax=Pandoraea iniqua TaxID=2508288 RepID=A0A5E4VZX4_9BURK|nr:LysR substrate-binding domain-containing protein [Pandoraea iniqua]VVE17006.1 LysR family transcriptional regulator [Pandoraea iniqua]VVE27236.1 LysR family transcriptional regulator [Pandoraea iniqua]
MRLGVPSLSALQAFEASARHQNFAQAAQELALTHGAVCKRVNELEGHLGVALFERVKQRLVLTPAGAEYAKRIRVHLDQIRRDTLDVVQQGRETELEIAVGVTFAAQWLIPRLDDFYASTRDVRLHIIGRDQPVFFDDSAFDATIYFSTRLWPGMPGTALITDDTLLLVAAPRLLAGRPLLSNDEIAALSWICVRDLPRAWDDWLATQDAAQLKPQRSAQRYDMFIMAINAAVAGLGVALLPRVLIERELASGALVQAHAHTLANPQTIYFSYPAQRRDWAPLQQFDIWLRRAVDDYRAARSGLSRSTCS